LILCIATIVVWSGFTDVGAINDDYQIIGYHATEIDKISDIIAPFYQQDISSVYYRPLPNTIHRTIIYLFGESILAFRIISLATYCLLVLSFFFFVGKLTSSTTIRIFTTLVFLVLPSHWYYVGWIAGIGDTLIGICACLGLGSLIEYLKSDKSKNLYLFLICVLCSALSKEHGYMIALSPFAFIAWSNNKNRILKIGISSVITVSIVLFISRIISESSLSESGNLQSIDILSSIWNFFIALPLGFIDHRALEAGSTYILILISATIVVILFTLLMIWISQNTIKELFTDKVLINLGLITILFALPALPLLMPWYSLYISIPLSGIAVLIINKILLHLNTQKTILTSILISVLIICIGWIDIQKADNSRQASEWIHQSFSDSDGLLFDRADSILILGYPQRINGINAMLSGKQQFVHKLMGLSNVDKPDIEMKVAVNHTSYDQNDTLDTIEINRQIDSNMKTIHTNQKSIYIYSFSNSSGSYKKYNNHTPIELFPNNHNFP